MSDRRVNIARLATMVALLVVGSAALAAMPSEPSIAAGGPGEAARPPDQKPAAKKAKAVAEAGGRSPRPEQQTSPSPSPTLTSSPSPNSGSDAHLLAQAQHHIKHVVFLIKENRTFDTLFGRFPGADGATEGKTCDGKTVPLTARRCR